MELMVTAIVFISMSVVLILSPEQLFSRHDPAMIRLFHSKAGYKSFLKITGYALLVIGIVCAFAGIFRL